MIVAADIQDMPFCDYPKESKEHSGYRDRANTENQGHLMCTVLEHPAL